MNRFKILNAVCLLHTTFCVSTFFHLSLCVFWLVGDHVMFPCFI
jgi:hypothetical protein